MGQKMEQRLKLLKAVTKVFYGITVAQFNEKFAGWSVDAIYRYLRLIEAERKQIGWWIE